MNQLISRASFEGQSIRIIDHLGERWIPAQEIGEALGYATPKDSILKIYERNEELLSECSGTVNVTAPDGKNYDTRVFNEEGVIAICLKSNQPKAIAFQRWAVRTLKAAIKGQIAQAHSELVDLQRKYIGALEQIEGLKQAGNRTALYAPAEQATIRSLLARGWGAYRIAAQVKRSISGVQHYMRRNGLKRHVAEQAELSFGGVQ